MRKVNIATALVIGAVMLGCGAGTAVSTQPETSAPAPSGQTPNWAATATIPNYAATARAEYPKSGTPWPAIDAGKVYPTVGPIQRIDNDPLLGTP